MGDKIGIPGKRSYFFTLAVMIGTVVQGIVRGRHRAAAEAMPEFHRPRNWLFLGFVLAHFVLHTLINLKGRPETHWSTGIHEKVRRAPDQVKDIMGWPREEQLPPSGPHINSQYDYGFEPEAGVQKPVEAVDAKPEDSATSTESQWYTVYGKRHRSRDVENGRGLLLAGLGVSAFCIAMKKHL